MDINILSEKVKDLEWTVTEDEYDINFQKYVGSQNFNFSISRNDEDTLGDIAKKVEAIYLNFDASEEAYPWLDNSGHGANGAPYDMIDVYNNMVDCERNIRKLYFELSGVKVSSENEILNNQEKNIWIFRKDLENVGPVSNEFKHKLLDMYSDLIKNICILETN